MQERVRLRQKLRDTHNSIYELERQCGVRLGRSDLVISSASDEKQNDAIMTTEISKIEPLRTDRINTTSIQE